ncbi:hypothetical protein D7V94_22180 [Parablautia intestinalis]|uniref:Uncharacterized protein n=1 Tax=Parablautia intestinalis TaxID=2320100 RepID=A0A3A9A6N5_9FIRM|nr:hypothetical protein D7V94_22180 [Parablautia intestinalis]
MILTQKEVFFSKDTNYFTLPIRKNETTDYYENFFKIILLPFMHFQTKSIKLRLSLPLLYDRILHKNNRVAGWADLSFLQNEGDAYENHFDFKDLLTFVLFLFALLWKAIHNAAKMTNSSVSISSVFIPTSFPFPERATADYPYSF